jgi:glycolate oxidase iron-sulfur subunit
VDALRLRNAAMTARGYSAATRSAPSLAEQHAGALLGLADQCVKCGYCLPHCPTFKLARTEAESPRGRIALIQGWLSGQISDGARLEAHLDNCLECRACEPSCPSLVRYGALMDGARALRMQRRSAWVRWRSRLKLELLTQGGGLRLIAAAGILYRRLLPLPLVERLGRRWRSIRVLDPIARSVRWPVSYKRPRIGSSVAPADRDDIGVVSLFRGCVAQLTEQPLEAAALRLFTRLGIDIGLPSGQVCCGAMHRHNGFPAEADQRLQVSRTTFGMRPVVGLASACVAELQEHGQLNAIEVCRFLLDRPWPAEAKLLPLAAVVAVHEPCSHRHQLRDQTAIYQLLQRIPGITLVALPDNETCCGAAGTYLTKHPETALALAAPKIEALRAIRPDDLVTTNTGCALHLSARAHAAGLPTEVVHPLQLIERQLPTLRPSSLA